HHRAVLADDDHPGAQAAPVGRRALAGRGHDSVLHSGSGDDHPCPAHSCDRTRQGCPRRGGRRRRHRRRRHRDRRRRKRPREPRGQSQRGRPPRRWRNRREGRRSLMFEATIVLVVVLIALLVTSAPIAVALGLTSLVYFYYFTLIPMTQVSERLFNALNSFPLMAIPFFILAANIMS